jgi:hypothetical protein
MLFFFSSFSSFYSSSFFSSTFHFVIFRYLNIVPSKSEINAPGINWNKSELNELKGSDLLKQLQEYSKKVNRKYKGVNKHVLSEYPEVFTSQINTLENYRWAHAILDSRRIWWNGEGQLVPMLDLVNCAEGPDPTRVHSTWLDSTKKYAVTKGAWDFKKNEQLFEPYGQPNHIYFAYHGFLLDHNAHDCVQMDLSLPSDHPRKDEITTLLRQSRSIRRTTYCVSLRKMTMELLEYIKIAYDGGETRSEQRQRLSVLCRERLLRYPTTMEEDERLLRQGHENYKISTAIKFRLSEKRLLQEIIDQYGSKSEL